MPVPILRKVSFDFFSKRIFNGSNPRNIFRVLNFLGNLHLQGEYFLAGGAIRNYFMNIPVNDYDVFFDNRKSFDQAVNICSSASSQIYIDMGYKLISVHPTPNKFRCSIIDDTNQKIEIDFVCKDFYNSPEKLIDSFDYTINQFCIRGDSLFYYDSALNDLLTRKLKCVTINKDSVIVFNRMLKFIKLGFTPDFLTRKKIFEKVSSSGQNYEHSRDY